MAEVNIQIGMTDGFGYIGAQPPLSTEQRNLLRAAEFEDDKIPTRFSEVTPA